MRLIGGSDSPVFSDLREGRERVNPLRVYREEEVKEEAVLCKSYTRQNLDRRSFL